MSRGPVFKQVRLGSQQSPAVIAIAHPVAAQRSDVKAGGGGLTTIPRHTFPKGAPLGQQVPWGCKTRDLHWNVH